jgi:hypothetical protein
VDKRRLLNTGQEQEGGGVRLAYWRQAREHGSEVQIRSGCGSPVLPCSSIAACDFGFRKLRQKKACSSYSKGKWCHCNNVATSCLKDDSVKSSQTAMLRQTQAPLQRRRREHLGSTKVEGDLVRRRDRNCLESDCVRTWTSTLHIKLLPGPS